MAVVVVVLEGGRRSPRCLEGRGGWGAGGQ